MHNNLPELSYTTGARTTAAGDTLTLRNISDTDSVRMLYTLAAPASGYTAGTNSFNDKAFAERYYFNAHDSSMKVIGVITQFGGAVSTSSSRTVKLKVWTQGAPAIVAARTYYEGFPGSVMDSLEVPVTQLGIGPSADTMKQFLFASPTVNMSVPFFVGYSIDYNYTTLSGDAISLSASTDGHRYRPVHTLRYVTNTTGDTVAVDTLINVQNATQWSDGTWHDNYTQNDSLYNDLAIFPIVIIGDPTVVNGVTTGNLTLHGCYPTPASDNATIWFSLTKATNATINIMDMSGRTVYTAARDLATGAHKMDINTATFAAGEYLYVVRTSEGNGLAGKMLIAR